jgi:hypothetical protein
MLHGAEKITGKSVYHGITVFIVKLTIPLSSPTLTIVISELISGPAPFFEFERV